jgi:alpha-amylase
VLLNLSSENSLIVDISDEMLKGTFKDVFSGNVTDFTGDRKISMQAWEYLVYEK